MFIGKLPDNQVYIVDSNLRFGTNFIRNSNEARITFASFGGSTSILYPIKKITSYPRYEPQSHSYDFSILTLSQPAEVDGSEFNCLLSLRPHAVIFLK